MYGVTKALQRARPTHPSRAWLTLDVKSNGWLRIGALNAPSKITIAPSPQLDHCVVLEKYLEASRLFIDRATNTLSITPHHPDRPFDLEIAVPEYFNVDIKAAVLNLCITKKMLGDVSVRCNHGTVVVDKLKGSSLHFGCGNGSVNLMLQ